MKRQVDLFKCWSLPKRPQSRELDASIEIQSEDSSTEFLKTSSQSLETTQSLEPNLDKSPALQTSETASESGVVSTVFCTSGCCVDLTAPNQPSDRDFLSSTKQQVGKKNEYRYLNVQWYKDFKWLHVCKTLNKVFCYYCLMAYKKELIPSSRHYEAAFVTEGFRNWKKAIERFHTHEASDLHREVMFKHHSLQEPTIIEQLSSSANKEKSENREMLLRVLSSLRYLLKQGLSIRGHSSDDGNLMQLLRLRGEDCPLLSKWIQKQQYLSPEIINELIKLMGNELLRQLLTRIREATWFSILADETTDIANDEQLSLSIRWVTKDYEIHEDFIGLVHVPRITSNVISAAIKDILIRCSLPISQCRGQGYDGASNMMGHLNGVTKQIQEEEATAISIHCFAHCLNLCLQDVAKKTQPVRNALNLVWEISKLINYSPKRSLIFEKCKEDMSVPGTGLRPLCPTRRTVRTAAIEAVLRNYPALVEALSHISDESHDDYGRRANGILSQLERFDTYFGLKLSLLVFSATEQTSKALQSKNTTVSEALNSAKMAQAFLCRQRQDSSFERFYATTIDEAQPYTDEPALPRYKRPPKEVDKGSAPHRFTKPSDYFRIQYFEVLDLVAGEISRRFNQKSLALPLAVEELLVTAVNHDDKAVVLVPEIVVEAYSRDVNVKKLQRQLQMLPDLLASYKETQNLKSLKVTSVRTVSDMLIKVPVAQEMFSEVDKLVRLYFTIPITTATAERSFSTLRRIKTYLRSTMTEERLNNIMVLHAHKDLASDLDLVKIAKTFVAANSRRQGYFGNFS